MSDFESDFIDIRGNPELLRLLYDVNPTLVFVKDRQGRFVFANKALAEVYGTTVEDLIGKTDADFNPEIEEIEHFLADDLRVMDTLEERLIPEERVSDRHGNSVWLQTIKRPLVDKEGRCNHVLGVCVDITQRIDAEKRELELQERLNRSERMESLGVMAGGIAHDLNNTLGPLVGYPDLLRDHVAGDAEAQDLLDEISRSTQQATEIIQDLLTLARRGIYHPETIYPNACVQDYLNSPAHRKLCQQHPDVEVRCSLGEDVSPTLGSKAHFHQLMLNIVTNAFEAIPATGRIEISTANEELREGVIGHDEVAAGAYVCLTVRDSGEGITGSDQEKVFEPFFSTKLDDGSGTGLGLAVVYGLVKDMSGTIELNSAPGEGTTFRIRVPSAPLPSTSAGEEVAPDLHGEGRLLVVDDLSSQRRLARRILSTLGYEVETASSGIEAVRLMRTRPEFHLAVIDMLLIDGGDGLEVFRSLKEIAPGMPCILASGYTESERVTTALSEGAFCFVPKPFTQGSLGRQVQLALRSARERG